MKLKFFVLVVLFLFYTYPVHALFEPNNKVGIHLAVPADEDIWKTHDMVNGESGKWGYVTLVIQKNDRNKDKWQQVFDKLRKQKLIPIIRIATEPQGPIWKKPVKEDAGEWVSFLSSLNWVIKERYIVLFNEPNHAQEWGGSINPQEYAEVAHVFATSLKKKNKNFFVMLAGFDAAAPSSAPNYEDEAVFLQNMMSAKPDLFDFIDGWASHSYPNPGFSASPQDRGRNTVGNYEWELSYLKFLGVSKDLPVFITETGWSHQSLSPETIGGFFKEVYNDLWLPDNKIRAVTPFVLNYQTEPFLQFSFQKKGSGEMYPHFKSIQNLQKINGAPPQEEMGKITLNLPSELLVDSTYTLPITLENKGQALWDHDEGYQLRIEKGEIPNSFFSDIKEIAPFDTEDLFLFIKTGSKKAKNSVQISLYKGENKILDGGVWNYLTGPLPKLSFHVFRIPKLRADPKRLYEIQLFDSKEQLVFKKKGVRIRNGLGVIEQVRNVYPGGRYRVVILTDYYLPRQTFVRIRKNSNEISFKPMIPIDFNKDGKFSFADITTLFTRPFLITLLLP